MTNQPRILITGGAGFLGSSLAYQLNQLGYTNLTLVDRLGKTDKWRNLVGLRYTEYLEVDAFRARRQLTTCDFDVVFALGACSSTREGDASYLATNNLADMIDLYQWCNAKHGIYCTKPPRFIYASSAATYGSGPMDDSLSPTGLRPINPYALSKNMFDQWLEARGLLDRVVGLKYFNVFGPNSRHKGIMVDFVAKTYDQIRTQGYAELYDTHLHAPAGQDARDFLYVKDAMDITIHFAFGAGKSANGLFNVGSGEPTSWADVALNVIQQAAPFCAISSPMMRFVPMPDDLKARFQFYTRADISKLRATGYTKPITPIADAVCDYVTNYLIPDKRRGETVDKTPQVR